MPGRRRGDARVCWHAIEDHDTARGRRRGARLPGAPRRRLQHAAGGARDRRGRPSSRCAPWSPTSTGRRRLEDVRERGARPRRRRSAGSSAERLLARGAREHPGSMSEAACTWSARGRATPACSRCAAPQCLAAGRRGGLRLAGAAPLLDGVRPDAEVASTSASAHDDPDRFEPGRHRDAAHRPRARRQDRRPAQGRRSVRLRPRRRGRRGARAGGHPVRGRAGRLVGVRGARLRRHPAHRSRATRRWSRSSPGTRRATGATVAARVAVGVARPPGRHARVPDGDEAARRASGGADRRTASTRNARGRDPVGHAGSQRVRDGDRRRARGSVRAGRARAAGVDRGRRRRPAPRAPGAGSSDGRSSAGACS